METHDSLHFKPQHYRADAAGFNAGHADDLVNVFFAFLQAFNNGLFVAIESRPYDDLVTARNIHELLLATASEVGDAKALTVLRSPDPSDQRLRRRRYRSASAANWSATPPSSS